MQRFALLIAATLLLFLTAATFRVSEAQTVLICRAGDTHTLGGRGPALTALLLLFDGTPVGGSTSDAQGNYQVKLVVGPEAPGDYLIEVAVRSSRQVLQSAICRVPGPEATEGVPLAPTQAAPPSATRAPSATSRTTAPTQAGATATRAATTAPSATSTTAAGSTATTTATATATATNQGGATSTPSATGQSSPTLTRTASATRTATGTTSSDLDLTIDVEDNEPPVGESLLTYGDLLDSRGDGIANIAVVVTFSYSGGSGQWCTATTDADGYWECNGNVTSAMLGKDVTLVARTTVNGRTVQEEAVLTPISAST